MKRHYTLQARLQSFKYAFAGLKVLLHEPNACIHCVAATLAIIAGIVLHIDSLEWVAIMICIALVMALEAVNTAVEAVCDHISPKFAPLIKQAKDVAASAVLIAAIASVIVALFIFIPHIAAL